MLALPLTGSTPELYHGKYVAGMYGSGEQGVWYEPSLSNGTLFQDAAGTTPVTAVEQPVGLMLDKRNGLVLGPDLVTNGNFDSGLTGWSGSTYPTNISVSAGRLLVSNTSSAQTAWQAIPVVAGKTYFAKAIGKKVSGLAVYFITFRVGPLLSDSVVGTLSSTGYSSSSDENIGAWFTSNFTGMAYIHIPVSGTGGLTTVSIDNVSVRELSGNHAKQTTSADRPVFSARYNLLTKTEQFNDAVWTKTRSTITPNATAAPDGTNTADKYIVNSGIAFNYQSVNTGYWSSVGASQLLTSSVSVLASTDMTYSLYAKASGVDVIQLRISEGNTLSGTNQAAITVNLNTGYAWTPLSSTGNLTGVSASSISLGDGWYRISLTFRSSIAQSLYFGFWNWNTTQITGDGVKGNYIWGASLVPTNQANLPYQRVNTATDYDADPVKFPPYLKFNGTNSWMVTNSINFTGTDKMTVFAGVRKLSDATSAMLVELGTGVVGSLSIRAPQGATAKYGISQTVGASSYLDATTTSNYSSPITNILTGIYNGAGASNTSQLVAKINGVLQSFTYAGTLSSGPYANAPIYIGRRAGNALPFNGNLYSLIIRGAATDDAHLTHAEKLVSFKTGVSL